jgi:hypothetical protein
MTASQAMEAGSSGVAARLPFLDPHDVVCLRFLGRFAGPLRLKVLSRVTITGITILTRILTGFRCGCLDLSHRFTDGYFLPMIDRRVQTSPVLLAHVSTKGNGNCVAPPLLPPPRVMGLSLPHRRPSLLYNSPSPRRRRWQWSSGEARATPALPSPCLGGWVGALPLPGGGASREALVRRGGAALRQ